MAFSPVGKLNRRVRLQRVTRTPDANGNRADTWTQYAEVWAAILRRAGRERRQNKAITEAADMDLEIRYRSGIEISHRVLFGSRVFLINDVDDVNDAHSRIILSCTEIVDGG